MKKCLQQLDRQRAVNRHRRLGPVQVEPPRYHHALRGTGGSIMDDLFGLATMMRTIQSRDHVARLRARHDRSHLHAGADAP